ncbi:hypothetical protein BGZ65_012540 [Modicella reniformis]|uniref:Uncharacterized protein n=1 Tax=Modicella reniformis TaxID=1440133 RepID=A0A9P6SNH3_9FUNG|nr:hypothetical protein BGZ65_012540 [Modicella reniformis]
MSASLRTRGGLDSGSGLIENITADTNDAAASVRDRSMSLTDVGSVSTMLDDLSSLNSDNSFDSPMRRQSSSVQQQQQSLLESGRRNSRVLPNPIQPPGAVQGRGMSIDCQNFKGQNPSQEALQQRDFVPGLPGYDIWASRDDHQVSEVTSEAIQGYLASARPDIQDQHRKSESVPQDRGATESVFLNQNFIYQRGVNSSTTAPSPHAFIGANVMSVSPLDGKGSHQPSATRIFEGVRGRHSQAGLFSAEGHPLSPLEQEFSNSQFQGSKTSRPQIFSRQDIVMAPATNTTMKFADFVMYNELRFLWVDVATAGQVNVSIAVQTPGTDQQRVSPLPQLQPPYYPNQPSQQLQHLQPRYSKQTSQNQGSYDGGVFEELAHGYPNNRHYYNTLPNHMASQTAMRPCKSSESSDSTHGSKSTTAERRSVDYPGHFFQPQQSSYLRPPPPGTLLTQTATVGSNIQQQKFRPSGLNQQHRVQNLAPADMIEIRDPNGLAVVNHPGMAGSAAGQENPTGTEYDAPIFSFTQHKIPWDISLHDMLSFFSDVPHPPEHLLPQNVHILMDRATGKTFNSAFIELALTSHQAGLAAQARHLKMLKGRVVTVELSSQGELMRSIFPKWPGEFVNGEPLIPGEQPIIPKSERLSRNPSEEDSGTTITGDDDKEAPRGETVAQTWGSSSSSTRPIMHSTPIIKATSGALSGSNVGRAQAASLAPPFVTRDEINALLVVCRNYKLHFSRKCAERPFENIISIVVKYPWHQSHRVLPLHRDHVFELLKLSIESLRVHMNKEYNTIDSTLLTRIVRSAILTPAFTERQKTMVLHVSSCPCPEDIVGWMIPAPTLAEPEAAANDALDNNNGTPEDGGLAMLSQDGVGVIGEAQDETRPRHGSENVEIQIKDLAICDENETSPVPTGLSKPQQQRRVMVGMIGDVDTSSSTTAVAVSATTSSSLNSTGSQPSTPLLGMVDDENHG